MDLVEEKLQFHEVVEALDCQDDLILPNWLPGIDIERLKLKMIGESMACSRSSPSIQNFRIQFQALEMKITSVLFRQPLSDVDFRRGVSGTDAENPAYLFGPLTAYPGDVGSKHLDGVSEPEGLNLGYHVFVEPIGQYSRKFVDICGFGIPSKLRLDSILIGLWTGNPSGYQFPELSIVGM
jgi:hypothetical protein